jgi:2-polyprenyl-3-methyl-5-hydroxy-6-metoxy-1,4-benzoquinol methylase
LERLDVDVGIFVLMDYKKQINKKLQWKSNRECPSCGCEEGISYGKLSATSYKFGDKDIRLPDKGISLIRCNNCSLIYKTKVPSLFYLTHIFANQAHKEWDDKYNFISEKRLFQNLVKKKSFDLLDVGPSNGSLLKTCCELGGRRSGLDVTKHADLDEYLSGEFIHGLIDDLDLTWSNKPYEIVALFDVLEHSYKPYQAFRNLYNLVKDNGYVVIETGDAGSFWPRKYGISNWWYVNLFEHHVFWTEKSLRFMADKIGFKILLMDRKTHKACKLSSGILHVKNLWKVGLYKLSPNGYRRFAQIIGNQGNQPWCLYSKNHLLAVLTKSKSK